MKFYRAYSGDPEGKWIVDFNASEMNAKELKNIIALKNEPDMVAEVTVPAGKKLRMSIAGKNEFGDGGILQCEILHIADGKYGESGITFKNLGGLK
ncbi:MAG: hypothetical protein LLG37_06530 [Spirochaetia bacterium]|nr:hypothetical protein [Spirochaetia bacterium]